MAYDDPGMWIGLTLIVFAILVNVPTLALVASWSNEAANWLMWVVPLSIVSLVPIMGWLPAGMLVGPIALAEGIAAWRINRRRQRATNSSESHTSRRHAV